VQGQYSLTCLDRGSAHSTLLIRFPSLHRLHQPHLACAAPLPPQGLQQGLPASPPLSWLPGVPASAGRVWRAGRLSPHGANLLVALYRRTPGTTGQGAAQHLVRLVYNEQVVPAPGCGPSLDCPLDQFLTQVVGDKANEEAVARVCGRQKGNTQADSSSRYRL